MTRNAYQLHEQKIWLFRSDESSLPKKEAISKSGLLLAYNFWGTRHASLVKHHPNGTPYSVRAVMDYGPPENAESYRVIGWIEPENFDPATGEVLDGKKIHAFTGEREHPAVCDGFGGPPKLAA